jgi:hypothetical protein
LQVIKKKEIMHKE